MLEGWLLPIGRTPRPTSWPTEWLTPCPTSWLTSWLSPWLISWPTAWLPQWPAPWLTSLFFFNWFLSGTKTKQENFFSVSDFKFSSNRISFKVENIFSGWRRQASGNKSQTQRMKKTSRAIWKTGWRDDISCLKERLVAFPNLPRTNVFLVIIGLTVRLW